MYIRYYYFTQEQILIVHIVKSIICRVFSVRIRHVIIHNAYTCTSHLTYTHIAYFVKIHTGDLYVNGWAALGGLGNLFCKFIPYDHGYVSY